MSFNRVFLTCVCVVGLLTVATPSWAQVVATTITFDEASPPVFAGFNGAEGTTIGVPTPVDPGPGADGGNALNILRNNGDCFAGAFLDSIAAIDSDQTVTARVYSPTAGIAFNTKWEGAGCATPEVGANEAIVVGWQTLSWNQSGVPVGGNCTKFVMLPNICIVDTVPTTYSVDKIQYTAVSVPDPLTPYSQDFEPPLPLASDPSNTGLADDGWLAYGNVFAPDGTTFLYNYGPAPFPAPNHFSTFSNVAGGEGGPEQGLQQLTIFNDYNNADHGNASGNRIEALVFQEPGLLNSSDVGKKYYLRFDAKRGNIAGATTAEAFIKTLDPNNGYAQTNKPSVDTTNLPAMWGTYCTALTIDAGLDGQLLQFGYSSTASNGDASGNFYDNVSFGTDTSGFTDTDNDGVFDCADPDDDNDGVLDIYDSDPLVANNNCTGGDVDNGLLQGATIADTQTCAANETVTVDSTTTVTGPDGDLHVISEKIGVADFAVEGGKARFINDSCQGPGCPTPPAVCSSGVLNTNGGFETGDFTGTVQFPNTGTQAISTVMPRTGTYSANLSVPNPTSDTVLKFANLDPGCFTEGDTIYIKFYMRGAVGVGGVGFAEFFSEVSGGGTSKAEILFGGGPIFPNGDPNVWDEFSTTATTGPDSTGGVTLQLKAASGGSNADLFFDDVCVSITPCP